MIREMARRVTGKSKKEISFSGNERDGLSDSATVLDHAPDLARTVADGRIRLRSGPDADPSSGRPDDGQPDDGPDFKWILSS
jgi:hypothetical protein